MEALDLDVPSLHDEAKALLLPDTNPPAIVSTHSLSPTLRSWLICIVIVLLVALWAYWLGPLLA